MPGQKRKRGKVTQPTNESDTKKINGKISKPNNDGMQYYWADPEINSRGVQKVDRRCNFQIMNE